MGEVSVTFIFYHNTNNSSYEKKNVVSILISYIVGEKCREHFSKKENSNEYVIDSVHFTAPAIILRSGGGTNYNGL